jgi:hypothetical protein
MAMRQTKVDDLDGSEAGVKTIAFALGGASYEIDLSPSNADTLREALAPFTTAGRLVANTDKGRPAGRARARTGQAATVRAWARDNGYTVPDRGRLPKDVTDAYAAAHP